MFFCAESMTARRSFRRLRFSPVCWVVCLDRLPDAVGDGVEPLGEGLLELRLPVRQHVAHGADQPGGFGLQPAKLRHPGLVLLGFDPFGLGGLLGSLFRPPPASSDQHDRDPDDGGENEGADRRDNRDDQQRVEAGQPVPDQGESVHPGLLARFGRRQEQKENFWLRVAEAAFPLPAGGQREGLPRRREGSRRGEGRESQEEIDRAPRNNYIAGMALRDILILPDKQLRLVSKPVATVNAAIRALADDMLETMYDAPGIGLAAIQIGEPLRLVTMDLSKKDDEKDPRVFINPEITWSSDEMRLHEEGCLSIPEYYEDVERPAKVRIRYLDIDGKAARGRGRRDLLATCIQHEIDHLNGVLFIDHISKLKRDRVIKKYTKMAKQGAE